MSERCSDDCPAVAHPLATFDAAWLNLRESADRAARDSAATTMTLDWTRLAGGSPARVIDLGCGTGATLRWLAPRLGGVQHWHLVDHDERLRDALPAAMAAWATKLGGDSAARAWVTDTAEGDLHVQGTRFSATARFHRLDIAQQLAELPLERGDLVCATALLDLVSADWLARLIRRARSAKAFLCLALTVDGRIEWSPALEGDGLVGALFERHQRRDKGFGPALGAAAETQTRRLLAEAGYRIVGDARSDWQLEGTHSVPLLTRLVEGMATAAAEEDTTSAPAIERWRMRRLHAMAHTRLLVGHVDLVAVPVEARA